VEHADQIVVERKTYQEIFRVEALNHDARWRDVVVRLQLVRHFRRRDGRSRAPHNGNQGKVEGSLLGVDLWITHKSTNGLRRGMLTGRSDGLPRVGGDGRWRTDGNGNGIAFDDDAQMGGGATSPPEEAELPETVEPSEGCFEEPPGGGGGGHGRSDQNPLTT
jgi:hypothetical protein